MSAGKKANNIANPGCSPQRPAWIVTPGESRIIKEYTTGITGSTGAGQGLNDASHFSGQIISRHIKHCPSPCRNRAIVFKIKPVC